MFVGDDFHFDAEVFEFGEFNQEFLISVECSTSKTAWGVCGC
jgi:hypothetical protein